MTETAIYTSRFNTALPWLDSDWITRIWIACGILMLAFLALFVPVSLIDERTVDGVNTWSKPIKFAVSLSVHAFTIAALAQLLERSARTGWVMTLAAIGGVAGVLFEQAYITLQAARARQSHFNYDTEIEGMMYALMGVGAILIILPTLVLGIAIAMRPGRGSPALRTGAILGLIGGSVMTFITAGYMSSMGSHWVGQTAGDANGLPLVGWSTEVGDLRVAHFVATHLMQTLPVLGLILDRLKLPYAVPLVWAAGVIQSVLVIAVFGQALLGLPLFFG